MQQMIPTDTERGYAKTSLKMTRSMAEDIGLKVKKILEDIDSGTVNLSYTEWSEFVSYCWNDEIYIMAINRAINKSKICKLNLNKNKKFLELICEKTFSELKKEMKKKHPIAGMSLMDIIRKKPPKPTPKRNYEDLWMSPKKLKKKYKNNEVN